MNREQEWLKLWQQVTSKPMTTREVEFVALVAAAQRQWVGLTHGELKECQDSNPYQFYRAIEAKLKEKNT
jgi:hypothetical protein